MVNTRKVAENIYLIDDHLYSIPEYGSVYLLDEDKKALIDTGPTSSVPFVLDDIRQLGFRPEDINYIIATHIHLDHAGGAGALISHMPNARVIVHHRGAKHLVDPSRLIRSSIAAQTQVEEGIARDTEIIPITAERVQSAQDGDVIRLSARQTLKIIEAPGHAPHELCLQESRNNGLFTGDAAGVSVGDNKALVIVSSPAGFDADIAITTLKKLMTLQASRLYFAHFGATAEVQKNLRLAVDRLQAWNDIIAESVSNDRRDGVVEKLLAQAATTLESIKPEYPLIYDYLIKHNMPMSADGHLKYYQDKHGIELNYRRNSESN